MAYRNRIVSHGEEDPEQLAANPTLRSADLADQIADRFGVGVHPRSVERALARSRMPKSAGR